MECHKVQKKLSAYQDRELDAEEEKAVRTHLLSCHSCHRQYEELQRAWQNLGDFAEIRPDPWFIPQVLRNIQEATQERRLRGVRHIIRLLKTPAMASILVAIGIVAGTYLGNVLFRCDFLPFEPAQPTYSQQVLLDSLEAFDPVPPGSLAYGYLQMANYTEVEPR